MLDIYRDLAWLEPPPQDFLTRLKTLEHGLGFCGRELRVLATFALNSDQLGRLGRVVRSIAPERLRPLQPIKLALTGNGTLGTLADPLIATAVRYGFSMEVVNGGYNQTFQEALSPGSEINTSKPDFVLLALDWRGLPLRATPGDAQSACATVEQCLDFIDQVRAGIAKASGAVCIVPTFAPPPESLFGSYDRSLAGTTRNVIEAVNRGLVQRLESSPDVLFDLAAVAETYGIGNWFDPAQWNMAKLPFALEAIPLYTDHVGRLLAALRGKSRRLLILDCDNTLWGGVVGDDGLAGIILAQGDEVGEAHLSVQRLALALRERGILLAICSKNEDQVAREVFERHPEMLLRTSHIAVFRANWQDKATNIKSIADELALGLEAVVFIDDNPAERHLIRQAFPEVAVPELGKNPAYYSRLLAAAGYFELTTMSHEDLNRAEFYETNARRTDLMNRSGDIDVYLRSLEMEIVFSPFDEIGRHRIAQLVSKSNQFNLTTPHYSEAEIQALVGDPSVMTLQVHLSDIFGDNGMISVIICRDCGNSTWQIDTWLMSCRVLGRGVERMVLREIQRQALLRGIETLIGIYVPTARNAMVAEHYPCLGFVPISLPGQKEMRWRLDVGAETPSAPMRVSRLSLPESA